MIEICQITTTRLTNAIFFVLFFLLSHNFFFSKINHRAKIVFFWLNLFLQGKRAKSFFLVLEKKRQFLNVTKP